MSRLGKQPVIKPAGVEVKIENNEIIVEGPKGKLTTKLLSGIIVEINDKEVIIKREGNNKKQREAHGLIRVLIDNMITGVTKGFEKKLEIRGVGYKAALDGKKLKFQLGHSHPLDRIPPEGIEYKVEGNNNIIVVSGIDKSKVGQEAAVIRSLRLPEPYKGKGVRYLNEQIKIKAGKSGKGA